MRLRLIMLAGFVGLLGFVMPSDQVIKSAESPFRRAGGSNRWASAHTCELRWGGSSHSGTTLLGV